MTKTEYTRVYHRLSRWTELLASIPYTRCGDRLFVKITNKINTKRGNNYDDADLVILLTNEELEMLGL